MNRLIRIIVSFVLPFFCLLINVSYADIESNVDYYFTSANYDSNISSAPFYGSYKLFEIRDIVKKYINSPEDSEKVSAFNTLCSDLDSAGYDLVVYKWIKYSGYGFSIFSKGTADCGFSAEYRNSVGDYFLRFCFLTNKDVPYTDTNFVSFYSGNYYNCYLASNYSSTDTSKIIAFGNSEDSDTINLVYSSVPIKNIATTVNSSNVSVMRWDGTSYYYNPSPTPEPDEPTMPTNSEIAQAVQAFYNSDYYKNNTEFDDFFVLYNYDTKYFDFIGHNFGINIGQVIVPSDYEYEGYSYKQDWWKFFLRNISSQLASNLWNRSYWLYSTDDFGENITYEGKGAISSLIDLHFSTKSIIVYSTTDYPVVKIETDENGVFSPIEGTVPGDQYTYDETLDPTTNEYDPLRNFVSADSLQTFLSNIDFDEINKTFEENKDILNIENASWLFTANNKLVGYFIGFLSLLIVLLIMFRILGG